MSGDENEIKKRGFAALSPERRSEIGRLGGKRVHELGTGHEWTREEARIAGAKGGLAPKKKKVSSEQQKFWKESLAHGDNYVDSVIGDILPKTETP